MTQFAGTSRYEIVRQVGAGGMGVVYEAIDRERGGRRVALKVLKQRDGESLLRLKREFRALADVRHPNLVSLYDLVVEADTWFFTLELIEGVDFISWVRPGASLAQQPTADVDQTILSSAASTPPDRSRARDAFRQLAEGVAFLHSTGRVHRDLKPSNVLVTAEGRVVILDFGLVTEFDERPLDGGSSIAGTAAYMAPEQAGAGSVGPLADWYAVGVMLFQSLTGRVPFEGPAVGVMLVKQSRPAPDVHSGDPALDELCRRLLSIEPAARPTEAEVVRALGGVPGVQRRRELDFIGRDTPLATLGALADESRARPRVARIVGESGIGKSALLRRFTELEEARGTMVLSGRCHEREQVPFKALDSVVDALARQLSLEAPGWVEAVLPRDAQSLARMFPVFNRLTAFQTAPSRAAREPAEVRRRAVLGLRELFARIADRRRVVVIVDDAQWGDADSARVLGELVQGDDPPGVLIIVASRGDLSAMVGLGITPVDLTLEPLPSADATAIARKAMGGDLLRAASVAHESGGNPFLLQQLIDVQGDVKLEAVVTTRLDSLSTEARRLLEVVALAATPVPERVAAEVAQLAPTDVDTLAILKAGRLLRGVGDDRVEPWHDRIREAVVRAVPDVRAQATHAALAHALRAVAADIDVVAWHLRAAGLFAEAAAATLDAALQASRQLAFERAAVLYRRALELLGPADPRRAEVGAALGDTLADAGHGKEAAEAYGQVMTLGVSAPQTIELRRRAAEQLLRAGHVDEGLDAIRQVLGSFNMHLARTPRRALVALVFRRAHLSLRGVGYQERPAAAVPAQVLQKIDACWSASMGLAMVDTIRGASFQSRQLLLALRAGEPFRVARALGAEAAFVATDGRRAQRRAQALIVEARRLGEQLADPRLLGLIDFCDGLTRFLAGHWREAAELTAQAERQFTDQGFAVSWEAANSRLFSVWSLFYLGDVAGLSVRIPALIREAERRGDRYALTSLQSGLANVSLIAKGDALGARAVVRGVMERWSSKSFHFQHYWALLSEAMIDLSLGEHSEGLSRLERGWKDLRASMLLRIQNVRIEATFLRARLLIANGRLSEAREIAFALEDEGVAWATGFSLLLRGLVDARHASTLLRQALTVFEGSDMRLFSAVARLRLGEVQQGELGVANVHAATAWMATQGIVDPIAFARMLAPLRP